MKVTTKGIILALKNIGAFLASYTAAGIKTDPYQFGLSLGIFILVTTPADLFLLNHWSEPKKEKADAPQTS
jgi:hypothetical protein